MQARNLSALSRAAQPTINTSMPPASLTLYSTWIARQSARPAGPSGRDGSGTCSGRAETTEKGVFGGFSAMEEPLPPPNIADFSPIWLFLGAHDREFS